MNFVRQIVDELSGGEALGKLSSLLGVDDETAESAIGAAAPSLLASLAGLATQGDGTRKLTSALGSFGESSWGGLSDLLGGDTNAIFQKGGNLLNNLFSATMLNGLTTAIAKYTGISSDTARNLLAYIAPVILGKVAALWRSRGGDASALTGFFAEQRANIEAEMPPGFSLADVPGLGKFGDAARTAGRRTEAASTSAGSWVVPLAIILIGAALLWAFMRSREVAERPAEEPARTETMKPVLPDEPAAMPEATALNDGLRGVFDSARETLDGIKDAATAEAAQPRLEELRDKLESAKQSLEKLPAASKTAVRDFVAEHFGPLKAKIDELGLIPALKAEIKALLDEIKIKFHELTGETEPSP